MLKARLGLFIGLSLAWAASSKAAPQRPAVLVAPFSGVISPVAAEFLIDAVASAASGGYEALVIELDTPGGLDPSMRLIVKSILGSPVPVVVYVAPSGARAASAGAFITLAAHVAAMAPGTNIGAAHPVALPSSIMDAGQKKQDSVMEGKMVNDAAAYLRSIAKQRGRNEEWAAQAVSKSVSLPAEEAVRQNVADLVSPSLEDLLKALDGRRLPGWQDPLRLASARIERFPMTRRQRWLSALSDPNVAMILMSLGAAGLFIELYSPGLIFPGVVGAVSLVLAFYSFQTLSANYAGVILILLGMLFFALEVKLASAGLMALAGAVSTLLGALLLFPNQIGGLRVAWSTLGGLVAVMAAGALFSSVLLYRLQRRKGETGAEGMLGQKGVAVTVLGPKGKVQVSGELWDAEAVSGTIPEGADIVVEKVEGLLLKVALPK